MTITLKSFAKINLFLKVNKSKQSSYHIIISYFSYLDLCDEITIIATETDHDDISIQNKAGQKIEIENNSISEAISFFYRFHKINKRKFFKIQLIKNIPIAAGLGGGSSNAARILCFLHDYYQQPVTKLELDSILPVLGADVLFFCNKFSRFVGGYGESLLKASKYKEYHLLLVNPNIAISTKEVYQKFDKICYEKEISSKFDYNKDPLDLIMLHGNDLLDAANIICPEVKPLLDVMRNIDGSLVAQMSGSGATCFALFEELQFAQKAKKIIKQKFPDYFVVNSRLLREVDQVAIC